MSEMSYEQQSLLHQFLHPEKFYPTLDDATIAGTLGTPVEIYRQIKAEQEATVKQAAQDLLSDADFAARVDRLPFAAGVTVVGLGDSITDDSMSWLELLRHLLAIRRPQDNIKVVNSGISGDTTVNLMRRFLQFYYEKPEWIICMIGTNDASLHGDNPLGTVISAAETERNLALLRNYAASIAQWVWITPYAVIPENFAKHWFLSTLHIEIRPDDLTAVIDAVRRQPDPVVDLPKALGSVANPEYMMDDGLHPSLAGQKAIVRALVERLT